MELLKEKLILLEEDDDKEEEKELEVIPEEETDNSEESEEEIDVEETDTESEEDLIDVEDDEILNDAEEDELRNETDVPEEVKDETSNDEPVEVFPSVEEPLISDEEVKQLSINIINDSIQKKWESIGNYTSVIASLAREDASNEDFILILKEILDDEYIHVGKLQQALSIYLETNKIKEGEEQVQELLDNEEVLDIEEETPEEEGE